ncbi:hypothetical protein HYU11_03115 [Candidatus Woesearchaeota archaeon]|nr:hypothetical protein [Candidatus Woesearchaeota archaeon]
MSKRFFVEGALFLVLLSIPLLAPLAFPGAFSKSAAGALGFSGKVDMGPFYPNSFLEKEDVGDLGYNTQYAIKKKVVWQTDRYGYRNTPTNRSVDVVIVGDSFLLGYKLSQDEILSEVLKRKTGLNFYSLSPVDMDKYLSSERFENSPPRVVIFQVVERNLYSLAAHNLSYDVKQSSGSASYFQVQIDKVRKMSAFRYYQSMDLWGLFRKNKSAKPPSTVNLTDDFWFRINPNTHGFLINPDETNTNPLLVNRKKRMLFYFESIKAWESPRSVENASSVIEAYDSYFKSKGIRFIFLPVPDKETVYYDFMKSDMYFMNKPISIKHPRPTILREITGRLKQRNVSVIDVEAAFMSARSRSDEHLLYFSDDTHWNEIGVNMTAELIVDEIKKLRPLIEGKLE